MDITHLNELLEIWKARLGLNTWRIYLEVGNLEDDTNYMEVSQATSYERAVIHVHPALFGNGETPDEWLVTGDRITDEFIESSIVHELLHLYTRDIRVIIRNDLIGVVQRDLYQQLLNTMERADERIVDKLSEALVKAFSNER